MILSPSCDVCFCKIVYRKVLMELKRSVKFRKNSFCMSSNSMMDDFSLASQRWLPRRAESLLLALHAPGGITAKQALHLREGHQIQVTGNRVLEGRSRHCKVQGRFIPHALRQTIDQPGSKGITSTDPVHDVGQIIFGAAKELPAVEEAGRPAIMTGTVTFPQGNGLALQIREGFTHLPAQCFVMGKLSLSMRDLLLPTLGFDSDAQG